jgi:serine/threonine protein kinase
VTRVGTLDYMAPEVVKCPRKQRAEDGKNRGDLIYGSAVDIWALGALAFELTVGRPPFTGVRS